jgi:hypothetical protein
MDARPSLPPLGMDPRWAKTSSKALTLHDDADASNGPNGSDGRLIIPRIHIIQWVRRHRIALARRQDVPADEGAMRRSIRDGVPIGQRKQHDKRDNDDTHTDTTDYDHDNDPKLVTRSRDGRDPSDDDYENKHTSTVDNHSDRRRRRDDDDDHANRVRPLPPQSEGVVMPDGSIERVLTKDELAHVARSEEWVPLEKATPTELMSRMC